MSNRFMIKAQDFARAQAATRTAAGASDTSGFMANFFPNLNQTNERQLDVAEMMMMSQDPAVVAQIFQNVENGARTARNARMTEAQFDRQNGCVNATCKNMVHRSLKDYRRSETKKT